MKNNLLKNVLVAALFCSSGNYLSATDLYLSSAGNDTNNGLSAETPVKTLSRAFTLAENGDEIHVLDFIDISAEPKKEGSTSNNDIKVDGSTSFELGGITYATWNVQGKNGVRPLDKSLKIIGKSAETCGFVGNGTTRLIRIDSFNQSIEFANLSFREGNSIPMGNDFGGAVYIRNASASFTDCVFDGNSADGRGGAAVYALLEQDRFSVSFTGCSFSDNTTGKGNGAVAHILAGKNILFKECLFENNTTTGLGCVFFVQGDLMLRVEKSVFKNNTAKDGGVFAFLDNAAKKTGAYFEGCAFLYNSVTEHGGAVYVDNKTTGSTCDLSFINTTFYGNHAASFGGTIMMNNGKDGSVLNLVNCTITRNTSAFGGATPQAGIRVTAGAANTVIYNIYNSIIENNYLKDDPTKVLDMSVQGNDSYLIDGKNFNLKNSFLGRLLADHGYTSPLENENYINYNGGSIAGLAIDPDKYIATQNSVPVYTTSPAYRQGNAEFLQDLGIMTDQLGAVRSFADGRCASGAIETPLTPGGGEGESSVYEHFIIYGQSLSTGHQSYPSMSTESLEGNYMIGDQVWINLGNTTFDKFNPLKASLAISDKNSAKTKNGGIAECPIVAAVNHLRLKLNDPDVKYVATSTGTGGKTIEQLSKHCTNGYLYNDFKYAMFYGAKISRELNSVISCPAIIWMQGEYNYTSDSEKGLTLGVPNTTDKNEYKALLYKLKNDMQQDVMNSYAQNEKPLFITYQTGAQYTRGKTLEIGMAQLETANENEDMICAGPVYPMTDRGGHLDANGYRWYGEMLGKAYYRTKVLGQRFVPLQPIEISRTDNAKEIKIRFLVPKLPLVLDDWTVQKKTDYGFRVYNDNAQQTITNIRIEGDCVYLTCAQDLSGVIEINYAGDGANGGHGNLRDSDDYEAYYKYIDHDKKNPDNSYFYPRDKENDNYVTLRPDYEPKTQSGEIIYDQPYPLYNFSVAFYYKLDKGEQNYKVPNLDDITDSAEAVQVSGASLHQAGNSILLKGIKTPVQVKLYSLSGSLLQIIDAPQAGLYSLNDFNKGIYIAKAVIDGNPCTLKISIR